MKLNVKKLQKAGTIPLKKDYQFYKGQYNPKLRQKIETRIEANKPINTTSEFIFDPKTMKRIPNPNAKMGLEIVSPEFQIMTAGVGSLGNKAVSTAGKIGQTMLHGAGQGLMANMSNLSGSKQDLEGLTTDVIGGGLIGGSLPVVGRFIKGVGNVTSPLIKKVVNNYKFNKLEKEAFKSPIYKLIQNNKGTFVEPSYEINNSNINDLILQSVKNTDGANIHGTIEKDGFIYLIKRAPEHNNTPEITSRLKSYPEIIPVHQSALVGNKSGYLNIQLQNKASGNYLHKIPEEDLSLITQKQINDAKAALEAGSKEGLDFDFLGDNNVFYDPKKGFQFIDLGTSGRFSKGKDAIEGFRSKLKHGITKSTDYPADYWLNLKNLKLGLIPAAGLYGLTQSKKQGGKLIPKGQQGLTFNKNPNYVEPFNQSKTNFLNLTKPTFNVSSILNSGNIGYDSDYALKVLDRYEGFKPTVYKNTSDKHDRLTIGHGLTADKYIKLGKITREDSLKGVKEHIDSEVIPHLTSKPYWKNLNDNQKVALIDYVYNIGSGNFNDKSPSLQEALNKNNWNEAAKQMDFDYNDSKNPGARIRRDFERRLFLTGNREFI